MGSNDKQPLIATSCNTMANPNPTLVEIQRLSGYTYTTYRAIQSENDANTAPILVDTQIGARGTVYFCVYRRAVRGARLSTLAP